MLFRSRAFGAVAFDVLAGNGLDATPFEDNPFFNVGGDLFDVGYEFGGDLFDIGFDTGGGLFDFFTGADRNG